MQPLRFTKSWVKAWGLAARWRLEAELKDAVTRRRGDEARQGEGDPSEIGPVDISRGREKRERED